MVKLEFNEAFPDVNYNSMVSGLVDLKHLEPTQCLIEMAKTGNKDLTGFIERYKHHSRKELDISVPRWDQDVEFVEKMYRSFIDNPVELADSHSVFEKHRDEYMRGLSTRKRKSFNRKLSQLREFLWLREQVRDCSTKMYYHIRRYVMALAEKYNISDDIFFMTLDEIFTLDTSQVGRRKFYFESYRNFSAPNEIGARFTMSQANQTGGLEGIGASEGEVIGIARIANSVEESLNQPFQGDKLTSKSRQNILETP